MSKLNEAIRTIKAGDKATGRKLLTHLIQTDPTNEMAWMWLAVAVENPHEKRRCLQRILEINPENTTAKQGLARLETLADEEMPTLEDILSEKPAFTTPKLKSLSSQKIVGSIKQNALAQTEALPKLMILDSPRSTNQSGEILVLLLEGLLFFGGFPVIAMFVFSVIIYLLPLRNSSYFGLMFGFFRELFLPAILGIGGILGFVGLVVVVFHIISVRGRPSGKAQGALSVHQVRNFEVRLPYSKVFNLCFEAALVLGGKVSMNNPERGRIVAKTGRSIYSWGETLSFKIDRLNDEQTKVNVSSKPRMLTPIDFGSNLDNVEGILNFLRLKIEG